MRAPASSAKSPPNPCASGSYRNWGGWCKESCYSLILIFLFEPSKVWNGRKSRLLRAAGNTSRGQPGQQNKGRTGQHFKRAAGTTLQGQPGQHFREQPEAEYHPVQNQSHFMAIALGILETTKFQSFCQHESSSQTLNDRQIIQPKTKLVLRHLAPPTAESTGAPIFIYCSRQYRRRPGGWDALPLDMVICSLGAEVGYDFL